tara:strand:- start:4600 stop:5610 length:1011 start_codon:yes stop_codon:yes gene_type:complete
MLGNMKSLPKSLYERKLFDIIGIGRLPGTTDKLFGVEIEAEGVAVAGINLSDKWSVKPDNSLRNNGMEFLFHRPVDLATSKQLLSEFDKSTAKLKFDYSERTSVHVHFNATGMTIKDLHRFLTLYYLIEAPFTFRCAGEQRVANLFCLRLRDATDFYARLTRAFESGDMYTIFEAGENERYLALNFNSFVKFGSLEFRAHCGTGDSTELNKYLDSINELTDAYKRFDTARSILEEFSALGFTRFMSTYLPVTYDYMKERMTAEQISESVFNTYHLAQDIAYCVEIVEDPKPQKKARDFADELPPIRTTRIPRGRRPRVGEVRVGGGVFTTETRARG